MSFHGPQHRGAMRERRETKRLEAIRRNQVYRTARNRADRDASKTNVARKNKP